MFIGVCLSTGGVPASGVPGPGGVPGLVGCRGACSWGVSGLGVGSGPGGSGLGGVGVWSGGVWSGGSLVEIPPMATAAGSMHPTGMHSCIPKC